VVLSKADLPHVAARVPATLEALKAVVPHGRILPISAHSRVNLESLVGRTYKLVQKEKHKAELVAAQAAAEELQPKRR